MFDVFTEEIEVQIKIGISNLYWYVNDLKKAWLRAGVSISLCNSILARLNSAGLKPTKREYMDFLYEELRSAEYNKRLEVSRNFVRFLIEHKNFVPHDKKHRIEIAETCALKLKEILNKQIKEREQNKLVKQNIELNKPDLYLDKINKLQTRFNEVLQMENHKRGYELEKLFSELMIVSGAYVEKSFKNEAEQIDGAIKHEGHYYLVELKWTEKKVDQAQIARACIQTIETDNNLVNFSYEQTIRDTRQSMGTTKGLITAGTKTTGWTPSPRQSQDAKWHALGCAFGSAVA